MVDSRSTPTSEPQEWMFSGGSMRGTLRTGDTLTVEAVPLSEVKVGDVVLFRLPSNPGSERVVAHRVVGRSPRSLRTRGDGERSADRDPVEEEHLIGRVVARQAAGQSRTVWGGSVGRLRARLARFAFNSMTIARAVLRPIYLPFRRTGWVARAWRPRLRWLAFVSHHGLILKAVASGHCVASLDVTRGRVRYRWPYDLVVLPRLWSSGVLALGTSGETDIEPDAGEQLLRLDVTAGHSHRREPDKPGS